MKVYLASPWFTVPEEIIYNLVIDEYRKQGIDFYIPREHSIPNGEKMSNSEWGHKVFMSDIDAIDSCDEVWVINHGLYSDSGTAWECGYAYAKGKVVRQFITSEKEKYSLMMINGCDEVQALSCVDKHFKDFTPIVK